MKKLFTILILLGVTAFGQVEYVWRSDVNFENNGDMQVDWKWWRGYEKAPEGNDIISMNHNLQTSMWNNLTATNRHKIIFLGGCTVTRIIGGVTTNTFYENGTTIAKIENYSGVYHKINFPFNIGNTRGLQINPVNGDMEIGQAVDNGGNPIYVYGNNSKLLTISGILSGEGKFVLEEYSKVNLISGSSFTGDVEINNGEFWVGTNGTMGSGTIKVGNTSTTNTTKLYMSNSGVTVSRSIIVGSGNASTRYIGGVQSSGSSTFSGNVDLSAQTSNATNFDVLTSGTSIEFSGIISGTNSVVNKIGSGIAIFSGANTYTGATNVNGGKLTIQGSGTAGTGALTIASGATLESSVSLANSSITVDGTFNVTDNITVNALTINSGATLSISDGKTLTIASGYALTLNKQISLGTGNIVLAGTATMTESATNYVITNSTGTLTRTVGASQVTFPIGLDASNYNPVKITNSGTSRAFAVYAKSTPSTATYNGNYVNCFWNITPDGAGVVGTLVFQWNSSQHGTGFVYNDPTLHIGRWTGTVWDPKLATSGGVDPYTATATGFTTFSEFGVGSNGALPVELTSFNAAIRNGLVDLKWETATEVNNYGFEVERKTASADWSKIGFVEGYGSTNSPKYYSYSDKPEGTGKIAYRLKQIDNDGQFEYSPEVEVLVDNLPNGFVLDQNYPNPFNPETSIRFALKEDTKATLKVYNSLGAEIATLFDGTAEAGRYYDVKFGGNDLASGFYIYKLVAGEYVSVKKMLLMK